MKFVSMPLVAIIALVAATPARAEVVFSNLNNSSSATAGSGFNYYAQRFTTVSAGTSVQVDLNLISLAGSPTYTVELWTADVTGSNVGSLLAVLGSGTTSSSDKTAILSFTKVQSLDAATNYFTLVSTPNGGNLGVVLGPASSATLNSVIRYGTSLPPNNSTTSAIGMQVTVATVPEPATVTLAGIAGVLGAAGVHRRRRRTATRCAPGRGPRL